jgi:hypothetical protein
MNDFTSDYDQDNLISDLMNIVQNDESPLTVPKDNNIVDEVLCVQIYTVNSRLQPHAELA